MWNCYGIQEKREEQIIKGEGGFWTTLASNENYFTVSKGNVWACRVWGKKNKPQEGIRTGLGEKKTECERALNTKQPGGARRKTG